MPVIDNKFVRWDYTKHSPSEKCEAVTKSGPCPYCKSRKTNFCELHGANSRRNTNNEEVVRNYRLQRWKSRVGELADSSNIKSLREEVGILRMLLEEMLNNCKDSTDLLLYTHRISDLVLKVERLVTSCDKLENKMGLLLSKDSILQLAATYVQIINNHVIDPDVIEKISLEMLQATEQVEDPRLEG